MKNLRVTQCSVARYNLMGNEEKLSFYASIREDDKVIKNGEISAVIHFYGDPEELHDFEYAVDSNDYLFLFEKCFSYANRTWSNTDHRANCLFFLENYNKYFEEISKNMVSKDVERIEKEIKRLEADLENRKLGMSDDREFMNSIVQKEIAKYTKWIDQKKEERNEYREGSVKLEEVDKTIALYENEIERLQILVSNKIP